MQDVFNKGYRDIVLEAPTGIGKTAMGATISAWMHAAVSFDHTARPGGYILVQQKVLQDQIERELDRLGGSTRAALIKSSIEYTCPHFKRCSAGLIEKRCACLSAGSCAYRQAKGRFLNAVVAVTNYAYFFTERLYVGNIERRHGLVLDECHSLARSLLRFVDVKISEETLDQFAPEVDARDLRTITTLAEFTRWIAEVYLPAATAQAELLLALNDSDESVQEAYETKQHCLKVGAFLERATRDPSGWVFWDEEDRDRCVSLIARPLDAAPYFEELVGKAAPLRVYMSAYPGEKGVFCRELGLDPQRVAWIRMKSPFDVKRRAVHLLAVGSLSRQNQEQSLPAALRVMVRIAEAHSERGIIHTHSYKLADAAERALREAGMGARIVYPKTADDRDGALKLHAAAPGAILISPSVGEGFDFRGELARWQVIMKTPFASLGDKHVAALAARDSTWYKMETVKALLQTCGRVCRSEDDHGETFILDEDAGRLLRETQNVLPRWFKAAIFTSAGDAFFEEEPRSS